MTNEAKYETECQIHEFIEFQFIEENSIRKVCVKCGIQPVRIPDGSRFYRVGADGSETPIEVTDARDGT